MLFFGDEFDRIFGDEFDRIIHSFFYKWERQEEIMRHHSNLITKKSNMTYNSDIYLQT